MGSFTDRFLVDSVTPLAVGYLTAGLIAVVLAYSGRASTRPVAIVNVTGSEIEN
jgi:hypothetical protein